MSRVHRGQGEAWLRGGQTVSHTWDMILEVIGRIMIVVIIWAALCIWIGNSKSSELEQTYGIQALQAATFDKVGYPFPQEISIRGLDGRDRTYSNEAVAKMAWIQPYARAYFHNQKVAALIWLFGVVAIIGLATVWFIHSGEEKLKARQIRGQYVVGLRDLILAIHAFNRAMAIDRNVPDHMPAKLVGVPYPFETEQEHTFLVGSPGSGKTQGFHQLIESIRARGDRAIIYDPELDFIRCHFNPATDLILNPYDQRSVGWNPYNDAVEQHEIERLAVCLFKEPKGGDPYWTLATRQVFVWVTFRFKALYPDASLEDLLKVFFGPIELMMYLLKGTPAASHMEGGSNPRSDSIKSVLAQGAGSLVHLVGQEGDFSIRKWVNNPEKTGGFLFMSAPETHIESLRPLLGFWSELVVSSLLGRGPTDRHATWIILDEFPSLGKVASLASGPERLRKYGGAVVLGLQQISQIQEIYGHEVAQTIIGQCATKLILRCQDPETAKWMSEQLGRAQIRRVDETVSYGANSQRDGVGMTPREELEPIALPEDVMNQPKLQGFIKVSNARDGTAFPIATIRFNYKPREQVAEGLAPLSGPGPVAAFFDRVAVENARLAAAASSTPQPTAAGPGQAAPVSDPAVSDEPPFDPATGEVFEDDEPQATGGHVLKNTDHKQTDQAAAGSGSGEWSSSDANLIGQGPRAFSNDAHGRLAHDSAKARADSEQKASAFERLFAQVRRDMEEGIPLNGLAVWKGKQGEHRRAKSDEQRPERRELGEDDAPSTAPDFGFFRPNS